MIVTLVESEGADPLVTASSELLELQQYLYALR
jgi:hypothetical protein